jgi:hypothetical protein
MQEVSGANERSERTHRDLLLRDQVPHDKSSVTLWPIDGAPTEKYGKTVFGLFGLIRKIIWSYVHAEVDISREWLTNSVRGG